jgi:hypothetical protein
VNDLEEITRLRIAAWTEHSHETVRRPFRPAVQTRLRADRKYRKEC